MLTPDARAKLAALRAALDAATIEREPEVEALLLALVAREHVLLVGAPGTGKSYLSRLLAQGVDGARYVERLLSPTTAPEEVWGPIDLAALPRGEYRHLLSGYVADAHVVYLDEVGRCSSAIRDSLLHILGPERQALVGTVQVKAPLVCCIGSSNTWPDDAAMLDRWLLRVEVKRVSAGGRDRLLWDALPPVGACLTLAELAEASAEADATPVGERAKEGLREILAELDAAGIAPSERRCRASVKIARARAVLDGAAEVERHHLEPLGLVLWDRPEHAGKVVEIVGKIANPTGAQVVALLAETDDAVRGATDPAARLGAIARLGEILDRAKALAGTPGANGRAARAVSHIHREHVRLQAAALGLDPAKAEALIGAAR